MIPRASRDTKCDRSTEARMSLRNPARVASELEQEGVALVARRLPGKIRRWIERDQRRGARLIDLLAIVALAAGYILLHG